MIILSVNELFTLEDRKVIIVETKEAEDQDQIDKKLLSIAEDGDAAFIELTEDELKSFTEDPEYYESEIYSRVENLKSKANAGDSILTPAEAEQVYNLVETKVSNTSQLKHYENRNRKNPWILD